MIAAVLALNDQERLTHFKSELLPFMNDAYNLARWLVQNDQDAHDMAHEQMRSSASKCNEPGGGCSRTGSCTLLELPTHIKL